MDANIIKYENILFFGDINVTSTNQSLINFLETYSLQNLITEPTCFKNPLNPSSIDVILTNRKSCFSKSQTSETGLSDYHKMITTIMKATFEKKEPLKIKYRSYKKFDDNNFRYDLSFNLSHNLIGNTHFEDFQNIYMKVLNTHAPMKTKTIRGNNCPFMNKILSKAFMYRSRLKNRFNKTPSKENELLYKRQRNFCVSLLKKEKRKYFNNLDLRILDDNKEFWRRVNPLFSDKQKSSPKQIILVENDIIISDNTKVAEKMNCFFNDAVENLKIRQYQTEKITIQDTENIIEKIKEYKDHPSILKIKENVNIE